MGEIHGLVRPYNESAVENYVNWYPAKNITTKDLYSQYDDDTTTSPSQNYFFLPKKEKDMYKFKQAFIEMNKSNIKRTNASLTTHSSQHKCKLRPPPPPRPPKQSGSEGDYCLIKTDTKPVFPQQTCSSSRVKRENLQEFSSRIPNYYSMSNVKIECEGDTITSHLHSTKTTKQNSNVDYRSCSSCITTKTLKDTADADSLTDEQTEMRGTSCSSHKSTFCRYLCMGVLTLFVPCILCYAPGRCRTPCTGGHSRGNTSSKLTYQSNNEKLLT